VCLVWFRGSQFFFPPVLSQKSADKSSNIYKSACVAGDSIKPGAQAPGNCHARYPESAKADDSGNIVLSNGFIMFPIPNHYAAAARFRGLGFLC